MKYKKAIYLSILAFVTLIGMCAIPALVKKSTYSPDDYPFVYYSSLLKDICYIDYADKEHPMRDGKGNRYTTAQFDSLMPLLNFRQLMVDSRLPDSIDGHEVSPQILMAKSVIYRYSPEKLQTPNPGLYLMYESMPKRVGLELPEDMFRLTGKIEFVDDATNRVNPGKSQQFQAALEKNGYAFPAQWTAGNMNPRKRYDEGYFTLDAQNKLFHIKMVNGRPYVRDTHIGDSIAIEGFTMYEATDKRFYGFLLDKPGNIYIVEGNEGKYRTVKLDIAPIDPKHDEVLIMGNLLYWTVSVTTRNGKEVYALHAETLESIQQVSLNRTPGRWDKAAAWLFPAYLTFEHRNTDYVYPRLTCTGWAAFTTNVVLALLFALCLPNPGRKRAFSFVYILLTGIPGVLALLILPDFSTKTYQSK